MKKTNKKGFTITELVIVIAVIAILAAVLIPTFSHVVENAKKSAAMQTSRNAMMDIKSDAEVEGRSIDGMVFVNDGYGFVYMNGGLHELGKVDKLDQITQAGSNGQYTGEVGKNTTGKITALTNNKVTIKHTIKDKNAEDLLLFTQAATGVTVGGVSGKKNLNVGASPETNGKTKQAEVLYFYEVAINGSTYQGCFTCENITEENPDKVCAYFHEGAFYSRLSAYTVKEDTQGETGLVVEFAA